MIENNRAAANLDRACRVLKCSKHSAVITQSVGDVTVSLKVEAKQNNQFDFSLLKQQITKTFFNCKFDSEDVWKKADELFLILSNQYNDNKISIQITDSWNTGYTVNYYNNIPQALIKV